MTDIDLALRHLRGEHRNERVEGCVACEGLPRISTVDSQPVHKDPPRPPGAPTGRKCHCGCGANVKRRFSPGHDAKLKSRLVREARDGSTHALEELRRYGWEHFV